MALQSLLLAPVLTSMPLPSPISSHESIIAATDELSSRSAGVNLDDSEHAAWVDESSTSEQSLGDAEHVSEEHSPTRAAHSTTPQNDSELLTKLFNEGRKGLGEKYPGLANKWRDITQPPADFRPHMPPDGTTGKVYLVAIGKVPGIYANWLVCLYATEVLFILYETGRTQRGKQLESLTTRTGNARH